MSLPASYEKLLRELSRSLDALEPRSFEKSVLDIDGETISIAITLSLAPVPTLDIEDVNLVAEKIPDSILVVEELEDTAPSVVDFSGDEKNDPLLEEIILEEDEAPPTDLNGSQQVASEKIVIHTSNPDLLATERSNDKSIIAIASISAIHPDPPEIPTAKIQARTPFSEELYKAWSDCLTPDEFNLGNPVLLEKIYQDHFAGILGVTFLRKVEQLVNQPDSGVRIHINLGATETYKLKNGLTLEGISFSHPPHAPSTQHSKEDSNGTARVLATIALSVIGTCIVASSVLALIPGGGLKSSTFYHAFPPISK